MLVEESICCCDKLCSFLISAELKPFCLSLVPDGVDVSVEQGLPVLGATRRVHYFSVLFPCVFLALL